MKWNHKYNLLSALLFFLVFGISRESVLDGLLWGGGALGASYGIDALKGGRR